MIPSLQKKHIAISFTIIFLLALFAYSRTFNGEFQFDDDISVIENPYVNGASKYSLHDLLSGIGSGGRPFTAHYLCAELWIRRLGCKVVSHN